MNRIVYLLAILFYGFLLAQAPLQINYQGKLSVDDEPANGTYDLLFSFYESSGSTTDIWTEPQSRPVSVTNGVFQTTISGFPDTLLSKSPELWLETSVETTPGSFTSLTPRFQLTSAPYAVSSFHSASAAAVAEEPSASPAVFIDENRLYLSSDWVNINATPIVFNLAQNGGGQLWITNSPDDNSVILEAFSGDGLASADELKITGMFTQQLPVVSFYSDTTKFFGELTISENAALLNLVGEDHGYIQFFPQGPDIRKGYIGFGDRDPDLQIANEDANGNIHLIPASGEVEVIGEVCASNVTCSSDLRFKESITPLNSVLPQLTQMIPVSYDWRVDEFPEKNFSRRRQIGLIAQDVEPVFPELVKTGEDGFKSLDYVKLSVLLLKATQEQQRIIEDQSGAIEKEQQMNADQQSMIATQQTRIDDLEAQVSRMESLLTKLTLQLEDQSKNGRMVAKQ